MTSRLKKIRRLIAPRLDIPFSRDDANRYLPYFIALMIFLASFFVAGGITVGKLLEHKQQDLSDWITLQLPAETSQNTKDSLVKLLKQTPHVKNLREIEQKKLHSMLSPWFGDDAELYRNLSLPSVYEFQLTLKTPNEGQDFEKLKASVLKLSPEAQIDNHQQWIDHYLNFIFSLKTGAYLLAFIVSVATIIVITVTSKTALKLHKDAIFLLHSVGAEDSYIARQFQFNAFLLGMRGGLMGVTMAALLFFFVGISINELKSGLIPNFPITGSHLIVWMSMPILTGLLSLYVARKTVLVMLRKIN